MELPAAGLARPVRDLWPSTVRMGALDARTASRVVRNEAEMVGVLRQIGIAFGALVIAWSAVWLVAAPMFGPWVSSNAIVWLGAIVLGGVVAQDVVWRERRRA